MSALSHRGMRMSCPWRLGPSASPPHCCIAGRLLLTALVGPCWLLLLVCVVSRWFGLLWFAVACLGVVLSILHALASLRGMVAVRATLRSASRG